MKIILFIWLINIRIHLFKNIILLIKDLITIFNFIAINYNYIIY